MAVCSSQWLELVYYSMYQTVVRGCKNWDRDMIGLCSGNDQETGGKQGQMTLLCLG